MIVDTSALIAILRDEADAETYAMALATADHPRISAANYLETAIVIDSSSTVSVLRTAPPSIYEHRRTEANGEYHDR